jgi:RNA polymerase sigma factor (TIGR02999 family)
MDAHSTIKRKGPPTTASSPPLTALLVAWGQGDQSALNQLIPLVEAELHRLARRYIGHERAGHTLQATALVNEAYLRLVAGNHVQWHDRAHFFAVSARLMRRILVDYARSRQSLKRGGGAPKVTLDDAGAMSEPRGQDLVAIDDALTALAALDERKSRVVELRFFGGLAVDETAAVLKVSRETVMRDWKLAKVWLARELKERSHGRP